MQWCIMKQKAHTSKMVFISNKQPHFASIISEEIDFNGSTNFEAVWPPNHSEIITVTFWFYYIREKLID